VRRVNWAVSNARVGQNTNFDRLTFDIWTDGTMTPEKALVEAVGILMQHLRIIGGVNEETPSVSAPTIEPETASAMKLPKRPLKRWI